MTPYQIGFLASRLFALLCAIWAASQLGMVLTLLEAGGYYGRQLFWPIVIPFAANAIFALILWTNARHVASAFVPEARPGEPQAAAADWSASLFRAMGIYFLVSAAPGLISYLMEVASLSQQLNNTSVAIEYARQGTPTANIIHTCLGAVLYIGARRLGRTIVSGPTKLMAATSLPDVDPPEGPPGG